MNEITGVDLHNILITGGASMAITSGRNDTHNIPCVIIRRSDERAESNRESS